MMSTEEEKTICERLIFSIIPKLNYDSHKGEHGRIATIGGSRDFTGAPYFASIASIKVGADLAYVICPQEAALTLKSYSPELMVFPVIDSLDEIKKLLPRLNAIVLGTGLGRNDAFTEHFFNLIRNIRTANVPLVLDADSLYFVCKRPDIISGYKKAILTPNAVEFEHLFASCFNCEKPDSSQANLIELTSRLSNALGGVTIVRKGKADIIVNQNSVITCTEENSARRCGGQGDILSGFLGTFSYWAAKSAGLEDSLISKQTKFHPMMIAAFAACTLTRRCNKLAFTKYGRNMTTSDMIKEIPNAFKQIFPVD